MKDFEGWEPRAAWGDLRFNLEYARKIDRVAMVGDKVSGEFCYCGPKVFRPVTELAAAERGIRAG
jgi:hypothetical protein